MAAIIHGQGHHLAGDKRHIPTQHVIMVCLIAWTAIGWLLFLYYETHISDLDWAELAAVPAAQADGIRAAYYADALITCILGAVVWVAGLIALSVLAWRGHAHR